MWPVQASRLRDRPKTVTGRSIQATGGVPVSGLGLAHIAQFSVDNFVIKLPAQMRRRRRMTTVTNVNSLFQ
jgi:hypothetical protein